MLISGSQFISTPGKGALPPFSPGIPQYNGPNEIYASNYGVQAKAIRYTDVQWANNSHIVNVGITPANSDVPFNSLMVGWLVFGTNGPPTAPLATATAVLPVGTITAVNSPTQIVVSNASTAAVTSTLNSDQGQLVIAPNDDTAALQAACNAAFTTGTGITGGHLILPQGLMWISSPITVSSSTGIDKLGQANGTAVGGYITGAGYNQSVLVPVPNASWGAQAANTGSFFFTTSTRGSGWHYRDFSIDGCGQYKSISVSLGPTTAALFLNQNSSAINVGIFGWGIGSGIAAFGGDAAEAVIEHCFIGGAGATYGGYIGSFVKITNSAFFWNSGTANLFAQGSRIVSINNSYDFQDGNGGAHVIVSGATSQFYSTDDMYLSLAGTSGTFVIVTSNGTAHINHAQIANPVANDIGIQVDAGSTVYLLDTRVLLNVSTCQALSIAGSLYDLGGNIIQTSTANSITGNIFGSASITGTAASAGNWTLSAGWGSTAAVTSVSGNTQRTRYTITASGTGQAANPTITHTFATPFLVPPVCSIRQDGGTQTAVANPFTVGVPTTTSVVYTYTGTPGANNTFVLVEDCFLP